MIEFGSLNEALEHFEKKAANFLRLSQKTSDESKRKRAEKLAEKHIEWRMSADSLLGLGVKEVTKFINSLKDEHGNRLFFVR